MNPSSLRPRWLTSRDALARKVETLGLHRVAALVARMMGESLPGDATELADWQLRVLRDAQARLCAYPDAPTPAQIGALDASLGFLANFPPPTRRRIASLLVIFEFSPTVVRFNGAIRRFTKLSNRDKDEVLEAWSGAEIPEVRAAFGGLKSVCMMGYWSRPQTWGSIGYSLEDNPGFPHERIEAIEREAHDTGGTP
jgi:hypothetical protein